MFGEVWSPSPSQIALSFGIFPKKLTTHTKKKKSFPNKRHSKCKVQTLFFDRQSANVVMRHNSMNMTTT